MGSSLAGGLSRSVELRQDLDAIAATGQPRSRGKALTGPLSGIWRYRIKNYRVLVDFLRALGD